MRYLLAALACSGLVACAADESEREPRFVPASREIVADETNGACFAALTSARCDHDQICGYVASGKLYETRDACLNRYNSRGYGALGECGTPLERQQLRECLASIKSETCATPLLDIAMVDACDLHALCRTLP